MSIRKKRAPLEAVHDPVEPCSPNESETNLDDIEVEPEPQEPPPLPFVQAQMLRLLRASPSIQVVEDPIEDSLDSNQACFTALCALRTQVWALRICCFLRPQIISILVLSGAWMRPTGYPRRRNPRNPKLYPAMRSVAHGILAIASPGLTCGHCTRCGLLQGGPCDGAGSRASPREVGRLRRTLSKYYLEICDAHTVGCYDPFGEHDPLMLAESSAKSDLAAFSPAEMHERFDYRGASSSKPLGGR